MDCVQGLGSEVTGTVGKVVGNGSFGGCTLLIAFGCGMMGREELIASPAHPEVPS